MRNRSLSGVALILSLVIVLSTASNPGGAASQQAPFFAQDLTLHQTTTSSGKGGGGENKPAQATTYFSRDAMRSSGESYDTIIRFSEGKMITIDHKKKTYTELSFQELQNKMDKMGEEMGKNKEQMEAMQKIMGQTAGQASVTKLGPGESIAGYTTEKYVIKGPMEGEVWAAPDLKVPGAYYDAMKLRVPANPMFDMRKMYDEYKKINGMQMKTVMTMKMMGMSSTTTTVVNSVDKAPIPPSTFQVPDGYKLAPGKF